MMATDDMKPMPAPRLIAFAMLAAAGISSAVSIDAVYFGQTHVWKPDHPYFGLVGERDCLIKAHVTDAATPAAPEVTAVLSLGGQTLNLPLTGPATLPASIPDGLGVVQHALSDTFTATIPASWVKTGLQVTVNAGATSVNFTDMKVGAPTKVVMTMLDVNYFAPAPGDYPAGWQEELEAKWPVADLELRRVPDIVFHELVIPPRPDVGAQAVRIKSPGDYTLQTGLGFDGEQAAALAWNGALKRAAGRSGRVSLYYMNIYGANAGGQAGGFAGVGNGTSVGILHHELGHSLSLPHWGDAVYPYKGDMHGILAPDSYNGTHAGPVWGYDLRLNAFIPPTVQPGNVGNKPTGTYKVDPMQGGGTGFQEPPFLMNHMSDYSVFKMREYLHSHVLIWNESLNSYASWNQTAGAYTSTVSNNGVQFPLERDTQVISVMASISGAKPDVNMVYPPIGPYTAGLIRLFDPRVSADRSAASSTGYAPAGGCDVSLRVIQGGVEKIYMLAAPWEPTADRLSGGSLKTEAINLPAADGTVTLAELLYTPDAQINGLPANPQVLAAWAPVMPDPAGFALPPIAGNSSVISMTATTGFSVEGPVEYLFTETSGNPGGSSSGWQSSPVFTDTGLQPSTTYAYTVTLRAGASTGRASAAAMATTAAAGIPGTITFDGFVTINSGGDPKTFTFDASGSDKLVVVVTGEHNFGGNTSGDIVSITYDGVSLTKAVEQAPVSSALQTTSDLWYLDNPGSVHTAGEIVVDMIGNGNNFVHTAIGLSGTAPGFAGASAIATGTPTVEMNVSAPNSMVIHWLTLGGSGNTAGSAYTVTADSPAEAITFGGSEAGSNWAGHALARSGGLPVGTNTFSFDTGLTDVLCLAAEFLAADIPATAYQIWASLYPGADLTDPAADSDGGGLPTGIEWVLGGVPTQGGDDAGLAPVINATSDPDGKLLFTYRRSDAAAFDPNTAIAVEYGGDLSGWTAAVHQGTGTQDITISEVPDGPGFTLVTVAVPPGLASGGRLFARLKVVVAAS
jgi:hypothetical protein